MQTKTWIRSCIATSVVIASVTLMSMSVGQSRIVKIKMRLGEEKVLEDGLTIGLTQGEDGLIVVTVARPSTVDIADIIPPTASAPRSYPRLGTYRARETTETVVAAAFGKGLQSYPSVKIRLISILGDGTITADFVRFDKVGHLNGRIDGNGVISLSGYIDDVAGNEFKLTVSALLKGSQLTEGTYSMTTLNGVEYKGVFKIAEFEK